MVVPRTPYRTTFRAEIFMRGFLVFQLSIYESIEEHFLFHRRVTLMIKNLFCIFLHEESIQNLKYGNFWNPRFISDRFAYSIIKFESILKNECYLNIFVFHFQFPAISREENFLKIF